MITLRRCGVFAWTSLAGMFLLSPSWSSASDPKTKPAPAKVEKPAKSVAAPPAFEKAPTSVLDPSQWMVSEFRDNGFAVVSDATRTSITATGKSLRIVSLEKLPVDTRIRAVIRFPKPVTSSFTLSLGVADPSDLKEKGKYLSVTCAGAAIGWSVFDPNSKARVPTTTGSYRPQFVVERSLAWPEALRANVEADMVASKPVAERWVTCDVVLRDKGYEVAIDGIPLATVAHVDADPRGFARIVLSPNTDLANVTIQKAPRDEKWVFRAVPLDGILNAAEIDGTKVAFESRERERKVEHDGVPFELPAVDPEGNDHVDIGTSWFRVGGVSGRYSGRGTDAVSSRWPGAFIRDPARITMRMPWARYSALHLLAAADADMNEVPVVTAQFYRAQAGFPKSFSARVPAFVAESRAAEAIAVKTVDGRAANLYHVVIPIDTTQLAEFADLPFVDVELTKQVQVYRASPDPMYYSVHAAGLPSSVHVYAVTAERPAVDVKIEADAYGHIWTAPAEPSYRVTLRNLRGPARRVQLELVTTSLGGGVGSEHRQAVQLPADGEVTVTIPVHPGAFGFHNVTFGVVDGRATQTERRSLAYLHEDTRERGNWDFDRGPLFGFWNWGGGHGTPSGEKQLLVMAQAGIETTPGSYEEYTRRMGDAAARVMEKYGIFTMKFAGAGDHYITATFANELKTLGLEKATDNFVRMLTERRSVAGPNSRPMFLSFYPEPSLGEITHGIFPKFIGEPDVPFTDDERERYETFRNGFVEGARIVRARFPEVKNLLPHGDPAFVIHFLQNDAKTVGPLLDGICVDIPCFERLPEQQFHQVSLHRLYMARREMAAAGIVKPYLPMYEGPCVPSGPGALTDQEQADLTIRNSLLLLVYGVNIQNGGFPGFDCSSYWGEQHYGFGVMNRVALETPKIAYAALATMTRHLNRANYHGWVPTGSHNVYALQFKHSKTGKLIHVMWTVRGRRPVTLEGGADVAIYDQNDNRIDAKTRDGKRTFAIDASPCYIEGLPGDAKIQLGEADHSDSQPGETAMKLANPGDGTWTISVQQEKAYEESHAPYIHRYPSPMAAKAVGAPSPQGDKALAVHFPGPLKDRVFVPYYSVLKPAEPITIPGKGSHLGLWVKAHGDWGRVVFFVRDAKGEQWINVGRRGAWNCDDLHSWTSFNFDGWRYLKMELPANAGYDRFRELGNVWWGPYSSGDGTIDLPLTLEKMVVERRTHVMYVDGPQPANRGDVLLGDLYVEYADAADATPRAVEEASVSMSVPKDVKGLGNPVVDLAANGVGSAVTIERITLPSQEADGTQCHVHFPRVEGAKQYDVWVAPYPDGRGALQLGKAWKEPGLLIRGLRPYQDFFIFATYTDAAGRMSKPSAPYKINLVDFFGMK